MLVSQTEPQAEIYERQPDGNWLLTEVRGLGGKMVLNCIGIELPLAEIYEQVEFDATYE